MKIYHGTECIAIPHPVVTLGSFDGLHLGHALVVNRLNELARSLNGESVVITFDPHPREVLYPDEPVTYLLTTLEEKKAILSKWGVENLIVLPFTLELAHLSYSDFVQQVLVQQIGMKGLVVGYDHRFGRDRVGNFENLQMLSQRLGFFLEQEVVFEQNHINLSSTKVRHALSNGDVELANQYLGRSYSFVGKVEHGQHIGRKLGFPTANVRVDDPRKLLPANGVYVVRVEVNGRVFDGMLNVGTRPTFTPTSDRITVEVHLFDFSGDLYGVELIVQFLTRLREERPFASFSELQLQLQCDKVAALRYLETI